MYISCTRKRIMLTGQDWRRAIESSARDVLRQAKIRQPPVDAFAAAKAQQIPIVWDETQTGRGRIARIAGRPTIFLRPDERPERQQWAAAHELGESCVWRICRALGQSGDDLTPRQREELANAFAKSLLLPAPWFQRDSRVCDYDLLQMKSIYATASHELIASRWLDAESSAIVTVFDQGRITHRQTNLPTQIPLTVTEKTCWSKLRDSRTSHRVQADRLSVRGWCVDSPGWEREILYAVISSDDVA